MTEYRVKLSSAVDFLAELLHEHPVVGPGALAMLVGSAVGVPASILALHHLPKGSLTGESKPHEKGKRTREANKLIQHAREEHGSSPEVSRGKDFDPLMSHMDPLANKVNVSYYGHPSLLAHELGHAANMAQDKKTMLGRMLHGATSASYTPLPEVSALAGMGGFLLDHPGAGAAGVGAAGLLTLLQLVEEARASLKARKMLKAIYGDKMPSSEYDKPLASAYSTYLAGGAGRVGSPLLAELLQEAAR